MFRSNIYHNALHIRQKGVSVVMYTAQNVHLKKNFWAMVTTHRKLHTGQVKRPILCILSILVEREGMDKRRK